MTDDRLRALERAFAAEPGNVGAETALLKERERAGALREYSFVPEQGHANTYGVGLRLLRESVRMAHLLVGIHPSMNVDARFVARPLTFKETIQARIANYVQNGNKHIKDDVFSRWLETCTAIVYKKNSTKFKIIPLCDALIQLPENFNEPFISGVDYDSIRGRGIVELDSAQGVYNRTLSREEVSTHPAWLAAVEGDRELLDTYADVVFAGGSRAMRFWTIGKPTENQLRALGVFSLGLNLSLADGGYGLSYSARFVRVRPQ